jgi:hypothetical protein
MVFDGVARGARSASRAAKPGSSAAVKPIGIVVRVPITVRLPVALLLVLSRRPEPRALGAVIATPAFSLHTFALLLAPLSLLKPDARPIRARDAAA